MKIAIDGSLLSGRHSGVERAILGMVTGLSRVADEDTILLYVSKTFKCANLPAGNVKFRRASGAGHTRLRRIFWQQCVLPFYMRAERADVFHGPGYVLPLLTKTPCVVTAYDIIALTHPELCRRSNVLHYRQVLPRSIRKAAKVIVPSEATRRHVIEHLGVDGDRIRVIPLGLDTRYKPASEVEKQQVREVLSLPEKYCLFVGNIEPKKNLPTLVQAFFAAKMNKRLPHKLVLAGGQGWKNKTLHQTITQLGMQDQVIFTGYVPVDFMPALYSAAEMFLFPSLIEGFGIPPLEAMACGTPVVVSNDPALAETTGDAALHVPSDNTTALREAIETLAERPELRRELVEKGRTRAAKFSWIESARQTLKVYHEVHEANESRRRDD